MNWIRNSPIRVSLRGRGPSLSPPKECDPAACFESFKHHWQQALNIINKIQGGTEGLNQDDILAVVNNLDQMQSLLVVELKRPGQRNDCLDFLLSQNILDQLVTSSSLSGMYSNILKVEQLKTFEMLLSNAPHHQLLTHEPFLRPLLRMLTSCINECFPADIEKRLILLLNQICVCLTQNPSYLDLIFTESAGPGRFVVFSLLIPYVHREGSVGHQARDAMLLCMALSKKHEALGTYIAESSNVCPVLATGLSGLYSRLPRKLTIETDEWHCFTTDDVNEMPELTQFLNSLEFCNAVVVDAHPLVQAQMLEFIHHGFLVPVVGPALLQTMTEELVASTAYLELLLRSITDPGLLPTFLRFLITDHYDGEKVIDKLISRLGSKAQLCMVSMSLFNTLIGLNCEDVLLELVFKYLISCSHVMLSQRKRIKDSDVYCNSAEKFLSLAPSCFTQPRERRRKSSSASSSGSPSDVSSVRRADSLHGNFSAYLVAARRSIESCSEACRAWRHPYDGDEALTCRPVSTDTNRNVTSRLGKDESLASVSSGYESFPPLPRSRDSSPEPKENVPSSTESSLVSRVGTVAKPLSFTNAFHATPDIGPFLDLLLRQLENMMTNSLYLNLQLTGLISRLASYSQPLLLSLLLNHSLVFQPSVKSLFQVLGSLKQRIDSYLSRHENVDEAVREAKNFLVNREDSIVNARRLAQDNVTSYAPSTVGGSRRGSNPDTPVRAEGKRLSISSALSSVLKKATQGAFPSIRENPAIEYSSNGFRFLKRSEDTELRQVVMCALVFDEWLKELAALALEHVACHEVQLPMK